MNISSILLNMKSETPKYGADLGAFLLRWRRENDMSQRDAAEIIDVSPSTYSDIENAKRAASIETLVALADATHVSLERIAEMAGYEQRKSTSNADRAARLASAIDAVPQMAPIVDALPTFSPEEVDTVLTVVELVLSRRQNRIKKEPCR